MVQVVRNAKCHRSPVIRKTAINGDTLNGSSRYVALIEAEVQTNPLIPLALLYVNSKRDKSLSNGSVAVRESKILMGCSLSEYVKRLKDRRVWPATSGRFQKFPPLQRSYG